jgi:3-phosphoglycerate kinase
MAFTFLKANGHSIGNSLLEEELIDSAKDIMKKAKEKNVTILLPVDIVGAQEFDNESPNAVYPADAIPDDIIGLDIGPESIKLFSEEIKKARTVIWNGPMVHSKCRIFPVVQMR